jgi:hypothetical protein
MEKNQWVEIGRVPCADHTPVENGLGTTIQPGHLTVWKLFMGNSDCGIIAIGRTLETAIRAQASDWMMIHAMVQKDRELYDEWSWKLDRIGALRR